MKIVYRKAMFLLILLLAFFASINGIFGDYFVLILILLGIGFIIFIYSIVYIIRNKKITYFLFTPFLIMVILFAGSYYGERHHRQIQEISNEIIRLYRENDRNRDIKDLLNDLRLPKGMEAVIENEEIVIYYRNLVYYVFRGRYRDTQKR